MSGALAALLVVSPCIAVAAAAWAARSLTSLEHAMPTLADLNAAIDAAKTTVSTMQAQHQGIVDQLVQVITDLKTAAASTTTDFTDQIANLQAVIAELQALTVPTGTIPAPAPAPTETPIPPAA